MLENKYDKRFIIKMAVVVVCVCVFFVGCGGRGVEMMQGPRGAVTFFALAYSFCGRTRAFLCFILNPSLMKSHNICLYGEVWKLSLLGFLSGTLILVK